MKTLTRAAIAVSSVGLVAGGATLASAATGDSEPNTSPAAPTSARQLAATTKPRVFAVVRADGTLHRGRGATTTSKVGTGVYNVRFDRRIGTCAWVGSVGQGNFAGSTGPGQFTVTGLNGTKNGLFVTTFNGTGAAADLPFHVVVLCS